MDKLELINLAIDAMKSAYAPYSGYKVGAALETSDGKIYTGCNIENSGYSATVCAERTAFFKAVSEQNFKFLQIAVVGGKNGIIDGFFPPCGVCRQVMREFCSDDFLIHLAEAKGEIITKTLAELLPCSFSPELLKK